MNKIPSETKLSILFSQCFSEFLSKLINATAFCSFPVYFGTRWLEASGTNAHLLRDWLVCLFLKGLESLNVFLILFLSLYLFLSLFYPSVSPCISVCFSLPPPPLPSPPFLSPLPPPIIYHIPYCILVLFAQLFHSLLLSNGIFFPSLLYMYAQGCWSLTHSDFLWTQQWLECSSLSLNLLSSRSFSFIFHSYLPVAQFLYLRKRIGLTQFIFSSEGSGKSMPSCTCPQLVWLAVTGNLGSHGKELGCMGLLPEQGQWARQWAQECDHWHV